MHVKYGLRYVVPTKCTIHKAARSLAPQGPFSDYQTPNVDLEYFLRKFQKSDIQKLTNIDHTHGQCLGRVPRPEPKFHAEQMKNWKVDCVKQKHVALIDVF
ncbi:unnamed protein product [Echinostoma caproni]|uniref:DDE_Tnp_1_7 domain-containing protein n=1 Tax=Echinostoma caproni TaxID=27848 RepID=A0A183A7X7_9TREM|nr:unnamed protein product [Echinostoma caproni]